jgi:hypothetical protein
MSYSYNLITNAEKKTVTMLHFFYVLMQTFVSGHPGFLPLMASVRSVDMSLKEAEFGSWPMASLSLSDS